MKPNITCIICPRGCAMTAEICGDEIRVTGNFCPKGEKYAVAECKNPTRTVTSSVIVSNREDAAVSVKTAEPVPKDKIFEVMKLIHGTKVDAPVKIGDIIIDNVFGTKIIATKAVD